MEAYTGGEGLTAEGGAVVAYGDGFGDGVPGEDGTDGEAVGEWFGHGDDVGSGELADLCGVSGEQFSRRREWIIGDISGRRKERGSGTGWAGSYRAALKGHWY